MWGVAADRGRALIRKAATSDDDATATVTASPLPLVWGGTARNRLRSGSDVTNAGFQPALNRKNIFSSGLVPPTPRGIGLPMGGEAPNYTK